MAYDAARREVVMFGGAPAKDTTFEWNGTNWKITPTGLSPGRRYSHGMAYDRVRQEVVLFGGTGDSGTDLGDTWTWDGEAWTQENPSTSPPARDIVPMAYDAARQEVVLFGGYGEGGFRDDTWTWDGVEWVEKTPPVSPPDGGAFLAYDAAREQIVAWAGADGTWTWNGLTWVQQHPVTSPSPRAEPALAFDGASDLVLLFGGITEQGNHLNDLWGWDGSNWTLLATACQLDQSIVAGLLTARIAPG